ncbi:MAG: T9SS type A sorting domain-containing protein [Flavobacteriales bacterium]
MALLLLFTLFIPRGAVLAQCAQFAQGDTIMVPCGDSVTIKVTSDSLEEGDLIADFNGSQVDTGFTASGGTDFSNPCPSAVDGTPYAWLGPTTSAPRFVESVDTNTSAGGEVCFDLILAEEDGSGSPCEGPDQPDEGVSLQYSNDGGSTWGEIFYFNPDTFNSGGSSSSPFVDWDRYCFAIPPAAQTPTTRFRWVQMNTSGTDFEHWGIDNIRISATTGDTNLVYDWGNGITSDKDSSFLPSDTSTYSVAVIDTVSNDTCQASTYVGYLGPHMNVGPPAPEVCFGDSLRLFSGTAGDSCSYTLDMNDSFGDGWNGASITVYLNNNAIGTFSASGSGTVASFQVRLGDQVELKYQAGSYESENTYALLGPSGDTLFQDGPSPQTGVVYSEPVQCPNMNSSLSYDWSPGGSLSDSTLPAPVTGTDSPTTYYLTVQDSIHSFCSNEDTLFVDTVSGSPPVSLGPDSNFCENGSFWLSPTPTYGTHVWNDSIYSDSLLVDSSYGAPTQEHWVTITDSNGCKASDTITLTLADTPTVDLGADTALCPGDTMVLDAGNFSSYQWDDGSTSQLNSVVGPYTAIVDTHRVTVTDTNACNGSSAINIEGLPVPNLQLGPDTSLCARDSLVLSTNASGPTWDDGSSGSTHTVDTAHAGLGSSQHWVVADNSFGCQGEDTVTVSFSLCNSLQDPGEKKLRFQLLPNPASESVRLKFKGPFANKGGRTILFDARGKEVWNRSFENAKEVSSIDVSSLPPGTYYLRVEQEEAAFQKKLIVE